MTDRDLILSALPDDLGGGIPAVFERPHPLQDLWLSFEDRLVALGGKMLPAATLPLLLSRTFYADADVLPFLPAGTPHPIWDAEVGVCLADLAIAETGSLVISAGPGRARLASLAPPVNVVLVRNIVATPEEALAQVSSATTVVVTGTSRTADIEGVLVRGVHGPRELYVVRIEARSDF